MSQAAATALPASVPGGVYFVSGHLDLTAAEFAQHYVPQLDLALACGASFVVGDARGCDWLTQQHLAARGCERVTVYHMLLAPRHNAGFQLSGGWPNDMERDVAMMTASQRDIAWVRPGREKSGTARNLERRQSLACWAATAAPVATPEVGA